MNDEVAKARVVLLAELLKYGLFDENWIRQKLGMLDVGDREP